MDSAETSRRALRALIGREPVDVARCALAVAREEYPGLDEDRYLRRFDELAAGAQASFPAGARAEQKVARLNAFLFEEEGFAGNATEYGDPKNSYLNEVLDRRTGIPITLSIVYVEVGRRCGLRVDGVGFPGHFLCKVRLDGGDVVIDAFHHGQLLGLEELRRRLALAVGENAKLDARVLRAARPREIIVRLLQNLRQLYTEMGDLPRALSAVDRMLIVAEGDTRLLRERATLYERLGGTQAAARDLEEVLRKEPDAPDAPTLRERVQRLGTLHLRLN